MFTSKSAELSIIKLYGQDSVDHKSKSENSDDDDNHQKEHIYYSVNLPPHALLIETDIVSIFASPFPP